MTGAAVVLSHTEGLASDDAFRIIAAMIRTTRVLQSLGLALALPMSLGASATLAQSPTPVPVFDQEIALTDLAGTPIAPDAGITITFGSDGSLSGFGGCNQYNATFQSDGTSLSVGPIAATRKACDPTVDALETQYLGLLQDAASWSLDGSAVDVLTSGGATIVFGGNTADIALVGSWTLASVGGDAVPADGLATATFGSDGSLSGSGGCNTFAGTYTVDGASLTVGPLAATRKICDGASDTENAYLDALQAATSWAVDGSTLTIEGTTELVFGNGTSAGTTPAGDWQLVTMNGATMGAFGITATFFEDGTVAGFGGCNQYHATWTADGTSLTVGPTGSTHKACSTTVDDAEQTFLGTLQAAGTYALDLSTLTIDASDGSSLVFQAVGGPAPSPETTVAPSAGSSTEPSPGASAAASPSASGVVVGSIVGSWQMTEYAGQALPGGLLDISITFAADGTFTGNGGCNDYTGSWTLAGTTIALKELAPSTGGTCDSTASSLEQGFLSLLPFMDTAEIKADGTLSMVSKLAGNTGFTFAPAQ